LIGNKHGVDQNNFNPIDYPQTNVDSYMEQYFTEQEAIDVVEGN